MRPPEMANGPLTERPLAPVTIRTSDAQSVARHRDVDRQRRLARAAELAMPLTRFYGPRPLRAVALTQVLAEGW